MKITRFYFYIQYRKYEYSKTKILLSNGFSLKNYMICPINIFKSIMIVKNDIILKMLNFIFWIQPPVADVYLTKDFKIDIDIIDQQMIDHILQNISEMKKINVI